MQGGRSQGKDELKSDLEDWGAPDEAYQVLEKSGDGLHPVLEENYPILQFFLKLQTQWRIGGMGGFLGLDYSVIPMMASIYQVELDTAFFDQLRLIESVAIRELNKRDG